MNTDSTTTTVKRIGKFYDFLKDMRSIPVVILWGGAGSGKSIAIVQELIERLLTEQDIRVLVVRKTGPSLTTTTWQMTLDVLKQYGLQDGKDYHVNKAERTIKIGNNVMWFQSLDHEEKKKSLNLNYCYIEETTELSRDEYLQLELRLRRDNPAGANQMFCTFNPTDPYHFTKTDLLDNADNIKIASLHSSFVDNPYLPEAYREKLRGLSDMDRTYFEIYALGRYAVMQNLVYQNYGIINSLPEWAIKPAAIGLDFGFNNPTAIVAVYHRERELCVRELLYRPKLTNQDLIDLLKQLINQKWTGVPIYADAAEPARIQEIKRAGYNVREAKKDVNDGIDAVKRYTIQVPRDSENLIKELRGYKWREDRNGRVLEEPIKINDHLCDALRYAVYSDEVLRGGHGMTFAVASGRRRW